MLKTIYLYNQGDLCEDITGGWGVFKRSDEGDLDGQKVSFRTNSVVLTATGVGDAYYKEDGTIDTESESNGSAGIYTNKKISLAGVTSLTVTGTSDADKDFIAWICTAIPDEDSMNHLRWSRSSNGVATIDTSDINGSYYVAVSHQETGSYTEKNGVIVNNTKTTSATIDVVSMIYDNEPPKTPSKLSINGFRGGKSTTISWTEATDPNDNLEGYIVEKSIDKGETWSQIYQGTSLQTIYTIPYGTETICFRVKAYDTAGESSDWVTSAVTNVLNNDAPTKPSSLTIPLKVTGGSPLTISWGASTDTNDNLSGYALERRVDGGDWIEIYRGPSLTYTDEITKGWQTVEYRVRAFDKYNEYSEYNTGSSRSVVNNDPPRIIFDDSTIKKVSEGFNVTYRVEDPDGDTVLVKEFVDGRLLSGCQDVGRFFNTLSVTGETFMKLLNGEHNLLIEASDKTLKTTYTTTFIKGVYKASVTMKAPIAAEAISVCALSVNGSIPDNSDLLIEVTNNADDENPVWEDCTSAVKSGRNHVFSNQEATNGFAFNFRLNVSRNEDEAGGYIQSIVGSFQ